MSNKWPMTGKHDTLTCFRHNRLPNTYNLSVSFNTSLRGLLDRLRLNARSLTFLPVPPGIPERTRRSTGILYPYPYPWPSPLTNNPYPLPAIRVLATPAPLVLWGCQQRSLFALIRVWIVLEDTLIWRFYHFLLEGIFSHNVNKKEKPPFAVFHALQWVLIARLLIKSYHCRLWKQDDGNFI